MRAQARRDQGDAQSDLATTKPAAPSLVASAAASTRPRILGERGHASAEHDASSKPARNWRDQPRHVRPARFPRALAASCWCLTMRRVLPTLVLPLQQLRCCDQGVCVHAARRLPGRARPDGSSKLAHGRPESPHAPSSRPHLAPACLQRVTGTHISTACCSVTDSPQLDATAVHHLVLVAPLVR